MSPLIALSLAYCFLVTSNFSPVRAQEIHSAPDINFSPPVTSEVAPAIAQTTSPAEPELAVEVLIERALENNPQPAIARANLEAARQRARALKSLPNPVLEVVAGILGSEEVREEEIVLSQTLDLFGQRKAERRVREAEVRRVTAESTFVTRALIVEVKNAATSLFAAQEAENLGIAQLEVAQAFRDAASRKAELGDVPPVQVQRAELELLRTANELENARSERLVRRTVLNQLLGQSPETPLRVAFPLAPTGNQTAASPTTLGESASASSAASTALPASGPIFSQRGALLSQLAKRPDIVGAEANLEARRAQVDAIGKQRLPHVELQVRRDAVFGSGDVALRAVITTPLFDFGAIGREKRAAQAEVTAQEAQIALLRLQAAAQVEQALIRLAQQRATTERYRTGIVPQTLDLLRKSRIGYDAGASTYLEVLEAQRTLRTVQTEYLQALAGVRASESQLESALGAELPESLLGAITNPTGPATPEGVAAPGTVPPIVEAPAR